MEENKIKSDILNFKSKNVFKVPEAYFENLPDEINKSIKTSAKPNEIFKLQILRYAAAAAILIAIVSTIFFISNTSLNGNDYITEKEDVFDSYLYFAELYDIDEYDITEFMTDEEPNNTPIINDEDILNYLYDNTVYYNELYDLFD